MGFNWESANKKSRIATHGFEPANRRLKRLEPKGSNNVFNKITDYKKLKSKAIRRWIREEAPQEPNSSFTDSGISIPCYKFEYDGNIWMISEKVVAKYRENLRKSS